jgi:hypothetical protein
MHEDDLRALIRDAIARHLDGRDGSPSRAIGSGPASRSLDSGLASRSLDSGPASRSLGSGPASRSLGEGWKSHLSHGRFVFLAPTDPDAPCIVEPQVRCHHCGFCQSYGH